MKSFKNRDDAQLTKDNTPLPFGQSDCQFYSYSMNILRYIFDITQPVHPSKLICPLSL